ncbi:MAG: thiopurine S-methyltransferase [Proteobacteria bacterium]|nr:thiopurine S-methyltransferase [Pseudomonadota bacterium]
MSGKLWKQAWENDQIDFHQAAPNPLLQRYWPGLLLAPGANVFVPLCGKSHDMAWLLSQNCRVTGIELSPIAVAAFFRESGLSPSQTRQGRLTRWHCERLDIYCGDIFDLPRSALADIAAVYDRAALLAFGPVMRQRYVRHLRAILPVVSPILLLTTGYPEDAEAGEPPFVIDAEIHALYDADFHIELLHAERGFETHPGQGHVGLSRTEEKAHLLRARSGR